MRKIEKRYLVALSAVAICVTTNVAQAVALDGRLYIDGEVRVANPEYDAVTNPDVDTTVYVDGSYFEMGGFGIWVGLQPAADGGYIELGAFQGFVTTPDVPHPQGWQGDTNGDGIAEGGAGTGYTALASVANILAPFGFGGIATHVGTLPVSYQTGIANIVPTVDVDLTTCVGAVCTITADFSSWEVYWNGSTFQQGPRPSNTGSFVQATGTFDLSTNHYEFTWASQIKGGPFNGVTPNWHIEGVYVGSAVVPVPAAFWLFGSGLLGLMGVARRRK